MVITICDFVMILLQATCQRFTAKDQLSYNHLIINNISLSYYTFIHIINGCRLNVSQQNRVISIQM